MSKVKQNMKRRKHENQEEERDKKQKVERKWQILKVLILNIKGMVAKECMKGVNYSEKGLWEAIARVQA